MVAAALPLLTLFQEAHDEAVHAGDGGALADYAWLIPVVPMVMTFVILFFGKFSPWKGWGMATLALGFVAVYGTVLGAVNIAEGIVTQNAIEVGQIGIFTIE